VASKIDKTEKLEKIEKAEKTEKPTNLRADVMPKDGYVLSVDGKLKRRYETPEDAMTAAVKLKQNYPVIQVTIFDAAARSHLPVMLPEQERSPADQ
jgi:hypothetical protein